MFGLSKRTTIADATVDQPEPIKKDTLTDQENLSKEKRFSASTLFLIPRQTGNSEI